MKAGVRVSLPARCMLADRCTSLNTDESLKRSCLLLDLADNTFPRVTEGHNPAPDDLFACRSDPGSPVRLRWWESGVVRVFVGSVGGRVARGGRVNPITGKVFVNWRPPRPRHD
ncbi:hypothetical protein E2C01_043623 [Portunus trituberculatus]|uniref:Uncharacterized protein n=1 Tax=Portunus trituberculatus TaxID=210409 RepID=A0A5B7FX74_PORTR|nr:hypothetical protein [Portunus trituberculatus]